MSKFDGHEGSVVPHQQEAYQSGRRGEHPTPQEQITNYLAKIKTKGK
jgi:hypothetical protein